MGLLKDFRNWGRTQVAIAKNPGETLFNRIQAGRKVLTTALAVGLAGGLTFGTSTGLSTVANLGKTYTKTFIASPIPTLIQTAGGIATSVFVANLLKSDKGRKVVSGALYDVPKGLADTITGEDDNSQDKEKSFLLKALTVAGFTGLGLFTLYELRELYNNYLKGKPSTTPTTPNINNQTPELNGNGIAGTPPIPNITGDTPATITPTSTRRKYKKKVTNMIQSVRVNVENRNIGNTKRYLNYHRVVA